MSAAPATRRRGRWKQTALWAVVIPGVILIGLWAFQRQLIYFPDRSAVPPADQVITGARDVTLTTADELDLGAWFVPPSRANDRNLAVLVAPGNGGNRADRAGLAEALRSSGFAVLLLDY